MPPSGRCRSPNPSTACACPAANAPMAMARVNMAHVIVKLFDCVPSVACVGVCVKGADVSGVLACEVSRQRDATMLFFGSWAMIVF
eukprot:103078-Pleurochrysis_carterae.AAC.1